MQDETLGEWKGLMGKSSLAEGVTLNREVPESGGEAAREKEMDLWKPPKISRGRCANGNVGLEGIEGKRPKLRREGLSGDGGSEK